MLARHSLSKNRIVVFGGVIAAIWVTIGVVIYRAFFQAPGSPPSPIPLPQVVEQATPPARAGGSAAGPELLKDPRVTNLTTFGEVPLEVKNRGNPNPFEPPAPAVPRR